MASLAIYAGPAALRKLQRDGFQQEHFKVLVGASGGPKWFVLAGLDRYLFGEFFGERRSELYTVGSSVGAWRMCCLATGDAVGSVERLAYWYSHEKYSANPSVKEITDSARTMLGKVLGESGADEIASNKVFRTHIVADRCKGIGSAQTKLLQMLHLGASAALNTLSRRSLSLFFERTLFTNMDQDPPWSSLEDISSAIAPLKSSNLMDIMIASGSIPFVLEGVSNIDGAKKGHYWDGGITDYHFDWKFYPGEELVLYPHFSAQIIPGWFDKHLGWRRVKEDYLDNVVLLAPSKEFVLSLPGQKIPDRGDFQQYDYASRVKLWQEVIDRSEEIAEDFRDLVEKGIGLDCIQAISKRDR
ncbi:MAG: patatin-like phospholipase family protein [Pseudomonadales bacterium]|nr:patatin-like phospholipase family protein [Pseudomonadales bacterium]